MSDLKFNQLELGWDNDFVSEITLNGEPVGVNWYGSKLFEIGKQLRKGDNRLVISYTTTIYNKMKTKDGPPQPSGLMGPVRLVAE